MKNEKQQFLETKIAPIEARATEMNGTVSQSGYLIAIDEEFFHQKYKDWSTKNGSERMEIRHLFIAQIEQFCLGLGGRIVEMKFKDQHGQLRNAVMIEPLARQVVGNEYQKLTAADNQNILECLGTKIK